MNILMVCLGNICRSPVAEGILRKKLEHSGLSDTVNVDSCGTNGLHNGESPDHRSQANALSNGLDISGLSSRQITSADFDWADSIYVMDSSNYQNVRALAPTPAHAEKVSLLLELAHPGSGIPVPDPYFGGSDGFQNVYDLVDEACEVLVQQLKS